VTPAWLLAAAIRGDYHDIIIAIKIHLVKGVDWGFLIAIIRAWHDHQRIPKNA
jgi:hypothetical protein